MSIEAPPKEGFNLDWEVTKYRFSFVKSELERDGHPELANSLQKMIDIGHAFPEMRQYFISLTGADQP